MTLEEKREYKRNMERKRRESMSMAEKEEKREKDRVYRAERRKCLKEKDKAEFNRKEQKRNHWKE